MRGGSIPLLAWGTLLLVLFIGNWIWDAKTVNAIEAAFAALVIYAGAGALAARGGRRALRRGPPEPDPEPHQIPQASTGAPLTAFGLAAVVLGFTFASFVTYFGAAMIVIGIGRWIAERRAERQSVQAVAERTGR